MVSILAVAGVVLWRGASEVAAHGLGDDVHAAVPSATIFLGVPISIFSLGECTHRATTAALWGRHTLCSKNRDLATGCHTQIVPVAAEMAPRHEHNIGKVVASGTTFCVVIVCPPCVPRGLGWTLQRNRNHDTNTLPCHAGCCVDGCCNASCCTQPRGSVATYSLATGPWVTFLAITVPRLPFPSPVAPRSHR